MNVYEMVKAHQEGDFRYEGNKRKEHKRGIPDRDYVPKRDANYRNGFS